MSRKIKWGILATGAIAHAFARGLATSRTGTLVAVGSRTRDKAEAFGAKYNLSNCHPTYDALLEDKEVEAIYISTPHPQHAEWAIKAMEHGKHVLVEKPIGINQYEAQAMIEAAVANRVFLMEAYMYRCHPQTLKLAQLLREKAIGDVRVIQVSFSFHAGDNPAGRIWNNALGGGGILDVGGYTTSFARLIAGAALGRPFADPLSVTGTGVLHPVTGVDAWAVGTLKFEGNIVATIATGVGVNQENVVRIFGSEGNILIPDPYVCNRDGKSGGKIIVNTRKGGVQETRELTIETPVTSFSHEADVVGNAIMAGQQQAEPMSWDDTLGNIQTQDQWRKAIGLVYEAEKPAQYTHTVWRRPLKVRSGNGMEYGNIQHLAKPVARLVMGCDNQETITHAATVYDEYFERGGNAFDTAFVYGRARSEMLGTWMKHRHVRDQVVVIAKGAHTPYCLPGHIKPQLDDQLSWLQCDQADIYMMHRDNPDVPVGEFVVAMNDLVKAGRIKTFGGSNWPVKRIAEANAYAAKNKLQGMSVLSNNLSLAEMVNSVWGGCLHVHDAADRKWLADNQMALLSWSSQARGFFVRGRAHPDKREDAELARCWYSADNFKRLERATQLAEKYQVEPINIALAWVLCQPFQAFALIGPRTLSEIRSTFGALGVKLSPEELRYLNLEE